MTAGNGHLHPEPGFSTILVRLRRQRVLIACLTTLCAAAALAFSTFQSPEYQAQASVSFIDVSQDIGLVGNVPVPSQSPDQLAAANADTIRRTEVLQRVRNALGGQLSISQLRSDVQAQVDPQSNLVIITATARSAALSARLANALAREAVAAAIHNARAQYASAAGLLRRRLDSLRRGSAAAERGALIDDISRLESLSVLATPAQIAETARQPSSPSSPTPVRNAILGGLLGLIIALFIAAGRDSLDRRLRDADEIRDLAGFPLLGQVGRSALGKVAGLGADALQAPGLETFRILRTNLEFLESTAKIIAVTSAIAEEGKTTVAASLSCASAAAGKRTLLVDCDLRRPAIARRLGLSDAPGLTDYLTGEAEPQQVVQVLPLQSAPAVNGAYAGVSTQPLACISAGSPHAHPAELLSNRERMRVFLQEVSLAYDAVIIDTSPILPVADTLELLPLVDGILLCVRASFTTRDDVLAARAALSQLPTRPTRLIVTGVREDARHGYYAGYYGEGAQAPRRGRPHLLRR